MDNVERFILPAWTEYASSVFEVYQAELEGNKKSGTKGGKRGSKNAWQKLLRESLAHRTVVKMLETPGPEAVPAELVLKTAGIKQEQYGRWVSGETQAEASTFFTLVYLGYQKSISDLQTYVKTSPLDAVNYAARRVIGRIRGDVEAGSQIGPENAAVQSGKRSKTLTKDMPSAIEFANLIVFHSMAISTGFIIDGVPYWRSLATTNSQELDQVLLKVAGICNRKVTGGSLSRTIPDESVASAIKKWSTAYTLFLQAEMVSDDLLTTGPVS